MLLEGANGGGQSDQLSFPSMCAGVHQGDIQSPLLDQGHTNGRPQEVREGHEPVGILTHEPSPATDINEEWGTEGDVLSVLCIARAPGLATLDTKQLIPNPTDTFNGVCSLPTQPPLPVQIDSDINAANLTVVTDALRTTAGVSIKEFGRRVQVAGESPSG